MAPCSMQAYSLPRSPDTIGCFDIFIGEEARVWGRRCVGNVLKCWDIRATLVAFLLFHCCPVIILILQHVLYGDYFSNAENKTLFKTEPVTQYIYIHPHWLLLHNNTLCVLVHMNDNTFEASCCLPRELSDTITRASMRSNTKILCAPWYVCVNTASLEEWISGSRFKE